ncbi:MAG: formylglycine-generating enzyme family protein [Bacteroides sp.]|nr:formylglycine-generating enzyme family protein [Bacteroides sp.]
MINVETGEIIATASANDVVDSMNKLVGIAEKVSSGLTGGASGGNNYFGQTGSQPTGASETFTVNGVSFEMVRVDGGSFMMGSYNGDSDEQPVHSETVSTFYIGKTEVTQALWTAVMGSNPSYFKGPNLPVEMVSWNDCQEFIDRLNRITGRNFRLPTEAEWEYAARGGNRSRGYDYSGSNNLQSVGWYDGNSGGSTHPVGSKLDNELGLYDMSGNVWEWTSDLWSSNYSSYRNGGSSGSNRVCRGGSYFSSARYCRSAFRNYYDSGNRYRDLGFRLAL